ncbi:MAG: hypothetical protein Gaeavirus27_7, partial [Gaeavirus sp.]
QSHVKINFERSTYNTSLQDQCLKCIYKILTHQINVSKAMIIISTLFI